MRVICRVPAQFCRRLSPSLVFLPLLLALICAFQHIPTAEATDGRESNTTTSSTQMHISTEHEQTTKEPPVTTSKSLSGSNPAYNVLAVVPFPPIEIIVNHRKNASTSTTTSTTTTTIRTTPSTTTTEKENNDGEEDDDEGKEETFWQKSGWYIISAIIVLFVLVLVGGGLGLYFFMRRRRRLRLAAEKEKEKNRKMAMYNKYDDPEFPYFELQKVKLKGPAKIQKQLQLPSGGKVIPDKRFTVPRGYNARNRLKICEVWSIGSDSAAEEKVVDKYGKPVVGEDKEDKDHEKPSVSEDRDFC